MTLKRTLLKYEANIFKRLDSHPAIPKLYGYGHFEHFEHLAIELLGKCLSDKDKLAVFRSGSCRYWGSPRALFLSNGNSSRSFSPRSCHKAWSTSTVTAWFTATSKHPRTQWYRLLSRLHHLFRTRKVPTLRYHSSG